MAIPLDPITRKKLILVRQLYQQAVLRMEAQHSYVDRIMAVIGFDLSTETALKAIVGALNPSVTPKNNYQEIISQVDSLLAKATLRPVPDKANIQHVRSLRNDAQHKAKYPNESDVSDSRTYTRDFLKQIVSDVWGEKFESLSLVDTIQNPKVKGFLVEGEQKLAHGDFKQAVVNTIAAYEWTMHLIKNSIIGEIPSNVRALVVQGSGQKTEVSSKALKVFERMRDIIIHSIIGANFPAYLKYRRITKAVGNVFFMMDGGYTSGLYGYDPNIQEAEYVLEFATNTILQIESLVGDIEKPFEL